MENEFKKYGIPAKWRKWIWGGTISGLILVIKIQDNEKERLTKELRSCNQEKIYLQGETVRVQQRRADGDSILIRILLQKAFEDANKRIIEPKLDSISNANL